MTKAVKRHGRVYTPDYLVCNILDFGNYCENNILKKHVIDNSCGDGAFLKEIVKRYCTIYFESSKDSYELKNELETYIHGIELDSEEYRKCLQNLNEVAAEFDIKSVNWNILNEDTLTLHIFDDRMDYIFGNPPYVRVHNLDNSYKNVKKFHFADKGMTDLFIVFFEIGFNMLAHDGTMCIITPSSWLSSKAGNNLRKYIKYHKCMSGLVDLEHYQPFEATTYTLISRFQKSKKEEVIKYCTYNEKELVPKEQATLSLNQIIIGDNFYLSKAQSLDILRNIKCGQFYNYASVKNGFATLADKIFIGDFDFIDGTINILKASTGKWSKCIYPYDNEGKPMSIQQFMKQKDAYLHLLSHQNTLAKGRDIENDQYWYLFGRTQALKDVSKTKIAINTIIKDKNSIKLEKVAAGNGVYSGLYILTEIDFETIFEILISDDFVDYIKLLKNYKSGGYYTFASKDLEQYLNYKLTERYGQSRISTGNLKLF